MALSANGFRDQRFGDEFGGFVPAGVHVYAGALCGFNAAGQVVPIQNAGAVGWGGVAAGERDNTLGTELRPVTLKKGTWALTVAGATYANLGQDVFAVDDNTAALATLNAAAVAGGANLGNGTVTNVVTGAGAKLGGYVVTFTGATTFTVADPNGDALPAGAALGAYADAALGFTATAGTNAWRAGDTETITVTEVAGMKIGKLTGIDTGQTYVTMS